MNNKYLNQLKVKFIMGTHSKNTVSVCHGLEIVPVDGIKYFIRTGATVNLRFHGKAITPPAVPGSVLVSVSDGNDGVIKKKIEWGQAEITAKAIEALDALTRQRLVATYIDERGNRRVCGSPDYPMELTYKCQSGVIKAELDGGDLAVDAFVEKL